MKKLFLLAVLPLLLLSMQAQTVNEDVLQLQKANASLRSQLKEQRMLLTDQTKKNDSIISLLQSAVGNQQNAIIAQGLAITEQQSDFNNHQTSINAIGDAFGKRKHYAIIAAIVSVVLGLLFLWFLRKRLHAMKKAIAQNEENLNSKMTQISSQIDRQIGEIKELVEKQSKETFLTLEKHTAESNSKFTKLSADTGESLSKMSQEVNKTLESKIESVKGTLLEQLKQSSEELSGKVADVNKAIDNQITAIKASFQEQLAQSAVESNGKTAEAKKEIEKDIAALKNELSAEISKVNERLK
ncbi:MAG: hypothetical protein KKD31_09320 [Bacteroidetes bacterium]|nr:hypothetical protein [Bacteroidota bacterium]